MFNDKTNFNKSRKLLGQVKRIAWTIPADTRKRANQGSGGRKG